MFVTRNSRLSTGGCPLSNSHPPALRFTLGILYGPAPHQHSRGRTGGDWGMSELKTRKNDGSVIEFLQSVENRTRREDAFTMLEIMKSATGKACLYINKLDDIDMNVLKELISRSVGELKGRRE